MILFVTLTIIENTYERRIKMRKKKKKVIIYLEDHINLKLVLYALKAQKDQSEVVQNLIDEHLEV